jgi:hypothetical protein
LSVNAAEFRVFFEGRPGTVEGVIREDKLW